VKAASKRSSEMRDLNIIVISCNISWCHGNHFLTGEKEKGKEDFFARRLVSFWENHQNISKKGDQIQSVIPRIKCAE
jgi:hypothetical protein